MGTKVITPVASPVIALSVLRQHLRLDMPDGALAHPEDALIEGYLSAARDYCEHYTQRSIGVQTLELALDAFPENAIELPLGAASITSVTYVDDALSVQTVANTEYALDDYSHQSWLTTASTWPAAGAYANAVKVRYVTQGEFSAAVKTALLLITAHLYENREESGTDRLASIPLGVKSMLDTARVWTL